MAISLLAVVGALALGRHASAEEPTFSIRGGASLEGRYVAGADDYALRCGSSAVRVHVNGRHGWRSSIDGGPARAGTYGRRVEVGRDGAFRLSFAHRSEGRRRTKHLRCLPDDFPEYSFRRRRRGGPALFAVQMSGRYAALFDRDGTPVWWYQATGYPQDFQVLSDGTVAYGPVDEATFQTADQQVRDVRGRLIRTVRAADGATGDIHELQLLKNGDYLIGAQVTRDGVDTTAFAGSPSSRVRDIELQELTPQGGLVWSWNSGAHIGLEETGRWWEQPILDTEPYDVVHWNAVDVRGKHLLVSFRHLDAIYEIDRRTGAIDWKLGGTETPESLRLLDRGESFAGLAGQHDARYLGRNRISIFNNRTFEQGAPRAMQLRIDRGARTATLIDSIGDSRVPSSNCCGSARRLPSGDWLVGWGGSEVIGAYDRQGRVIFRLRTPGSGSYRANPVPPGAVTRPALRAAMNSMARRRPITRVSPASDP